MKLRSCTHLHFIKAIKAGLVESICNVNSCGRPALVFKTLKDIYESEDVKKLDSFSTLQSQDTADMVFECDRVKTESPCLVVVERKTKKRDINSDEFNYNSDDDDDEDSDSDDLLFVKMTLQQLKEQCKTKKRKVLHSTCLTRNQYYTDWQPEEDECDLEEPISIWKSKLPNNLKGKRKRAKKCASSSQTAVSVKSDQILSAEDSLPSSGYSPSPIHTKAEVSEADYTESRNMICVADDLSIGCSELVGLFGKVSSEISDAVKIESESGKQISLAEECQSCVVNEVSCDFRDPIEPTPVLPSVGGETVEVDNLENTFQLSPVLPTSEDKEGYIEHPHLEESSPETVFPVMDQSSDISNNSPNCSSVHEISRQTSGISGVQVPEMAMDNSLFCMELYSAGDPCKFENDINENLPNIENDSRSSPLSNCSSSWNSNPCLSPEIVLVSVEDDLPATEKPPVTSVSTDAVRSCLNLDEIPVAFEGGSTIIEEKQSPRSAPDDAESNSTNRNHHFDGAYELSVPEIKNYHHLEKMHPPERLLSTRKAISPTSQEKLCQAMKGVELHEDLDHYKCKEKLQLGKEAENNASPVGLYAEGAKVNVNLEGLGDVSRAKGTTSPQKITKKLKNDRKGSPPNGIRKGPHLSRSPPHVSTRATSIQNCSESAIAFSERQMHGIERLAMKLMQELKSMKDIVEGNLHSEAAPITLLKYDVDQVKTAIKSATKVEETTKKWLSMMARDCNRFCKLVRLNDKDDIASGNAFHKERRKITFADEAGGVLCHVKFFEDSVASPDSKS